MDSSVPPEPAAMRPTDPPAKDPAAHDAAGRAAAESRALAFFCTHAGFSCARCHVGDIQGTRFRCLSARGDVSLCERCRRAVGDAADCRAFVVYDHPWEATDDYAEAGRELSYCTDSLKTPPPPLALGDVGPRVTHLQFVLYKVGYLSLVHPCFRVGLFCRMTQDGIARFQTDHHAGATSQDPVSVDQEQLGVYTALVRTVLLSLFEEFEMRRNTARCTNMSGTQSSQIRTAMAA